MQKSGFTARFIAVAIVGALALAGCGGDKESAAPKRKKRPPPSTTTTTTAPVPIAPFTGLPDPDGVANARASLAVKIENSPAARPQSGLDVADIVYEEVVEGGITRFWAVFNSNAPNVIGPVRSVRAMDPPIVRPLGGVIAFSGGTSPNVAAVRATGLLWVDESNAGNNFFREGSRSAPHNLYAHSSLLFQRGGKPIPPRPMFQYVEDDATFTGDPVASFYADFDQGYDVTYVWDAGISRWRRSQSGAPFMAVGSTFTPTQVAPENVIIQFINYPRGSEGETIGGGEAWYFSNGQLVKGYWKKTYYGAATTFVNAFGVPIRLTPGRTWVELLPAGRGVNVFPGAPLPTTTSTSAPKKDTKKSNN